MPQLTDKDKEIRHLIWETVFLHVTGANKDDLASVTNAKKYIKEFFKQT